MDISVLPVDRKNHLIQSNQHINRQHYKHPIPSPLAHALISIHLPGDASRLLTIDCAPLPVGEGGWVGRGYCNLGPLQKSLLRGGGEGLGGAAWHCYGGGRGGGGGRGSPR